MQERHPLPFALQLKQERERRGWSQADVAEKVGSDIKTVNRWESGKTLPRHHFRRTFTELFGKSVEELGLLNKENGNGDTSSVSSQIPQRSSVPSPTAASELASVHGQAPTFPASSEDWGEAPLGGRFYGRREERSILQDWLVQARCKVIAVVGLGGVGKTSLAVAVAKQEREQFEYIFWRSLQHAPHPCHILKQCIQFVADQQRLPIPETIDEQLALLVPYFKEHRCLLVLDNMESILQSGQQVGQYLEGYEDYGKLIHRLGNLDHQSCLLLTSREKPGDFALLEERTGPVRSLLLQGVGQAEGKTILKDKGLMGSEQEWLDLIDLYSGNPLALKLVSETIREVFGGEIGRFLREKEVALD